MDVNPTKPEQDEHTLSMDMELKADDILPHATTLTFPAIVDPATLATSEPSEPVTLDRHNEHDHLEDEQPFGWVVVAAAFFVQAVVIGTVNGYGVYQDRYINHEYTAASTFDLSWIGTLNVMGMDLTGPITGQLADHFGYRVSAFLGALIMGASLIATSFSTKVWQLYIFQGVLYGFGASLAFFPSLSLPSQWFKRRRGFATGIAVAGGGFGGLCISPATTALFDAIGYRWTVRTMAFIHLAVLIPASFLFKGRVESGVQKAKRLKRERADREALAHAKGLPTQMEGKELVSQITLVDTKEQKPKRLDFTALKEKEFLILFFIGLTVAMGYFNPYYFFPTYARNHGTSTSTASLLIGILNGSSAVGRVTMGLASDYIGDINTLLISSGISALSILVVWMFASTSVAVMAVFCVMYGFFSGSFVAIIPTVAAHLCGISRLASVTGIIYGGIAVGTLIGSPVGGAILDTSGGVNFKPLQLWAGLVMVVGTILTVVLKFMMNRNIFGRV